MTGRFERGFQIGQRAHGRRFNDLVSPGLWARFICGGRTTHSKINVAVDGLCDCPDLSQAPNSAVIWDEHSAQHPLAVEAINHDYFVCIYIYIF